MLISLHLPKTAGTSFRTSLEEHFGNKILNDYADRPRNTPPYERHQFALESSLNNVNKDYLHIACIHGHFLPLKYLLLADIKELQFVTWMRNPIERVLSHYYYWRRTYNPKTAAKLQKIMVEEDWSIERFCLDEGVQNLYTQFLWGFPMEQFSFIGITEYYDEDFEYFSRKYLGRTLEVKKLNTNANNKYMIDSSLRVKLEAFHSKDMYLYHKALELRKKRL